MFFLSVIAKKSANSYFALAELNVFPNLVKLLGTDSSLLKGRVCNLIGNMVKFNDYFLQDIIKHEIITLVIDALKSEDKICRKYACFALGNIAYHNEAIYSYLLTSIKYLVEALDSEDDGTKANAAGALSNFTRNSDTLCGELIKHGAPSRLISLVEDSNTANNTVRIGIFALGNFANYTNMKEELKQLKFVERLKKLSERFVDSKDTMDLIVKIIKKF